MRIDSLPPLLARGLMAALPKATAGFPLAAEEAAAARQQGVQEPASAHPATSVAMLVTLAAIDPERERRHKIARHAERGIDALERLHKEMLAGTPSVERLREIAKWSQDMEPQEDPTLASLMAEIDLRVRVELAKYDVEI